MMKFKKKKKTTNKHTSFHILYKTSFGKSWVPTAIQVHYLPHL